MAELADAPDSGSGGGNAVRVQIPPSAFCNTLIFKKKYPKKKVKKKFSASCHPVVVGGLEGFICGSIFGKIALFSFFWYRQIKVL